MPTWKGSLCGNLVVYSYQVMRDCWCADPGLRPTFSELAEKISDVLTEVRSRLRTFLVTSVHRVQGAAAQYLQLTPTGRHQPDIIPASFKTLPRNFRIRSEEEEPSPPSPAKEAAKLVRQMTVSNPGYTSDTQRTPPPDPNPPEQQQE